MYARAQLKEALTNVLVAKLRSFLAILGVLVGTASVVALISSGELATQHALEQFKTLGTNLLSVSVSEGGGGGGEEDSAQKAEQRVELNLENVQGIQKAVPDIVEVAPYATDYTSVYYDGNDLNASIIGTTQSLPDIVKIRLSKGRFVSHLDQHAFYCVIGYEIAQQLQKLGVKNPIGKQVLVGNEYFTIIGVAKKWPQNSFMYTAINRALIVPLNTVLLLSKYAKISNIIFKIKPDVDIDTIQADVRQAIMHIAPDKRLFFRSPKELIASMEEQRKTFTLLLGLIGSIALVVGGIGVMNIMLVSVVERRREIGIRLAVGAKRGDIQSMFLFEAITLTLFGGLMGVILGILSSYIIAITSGWTFQFFILPPTLGFVVSVLIGIFFGFYPARQASKLDPIQTLRAD